LPDFAIGNEVVGAVQIQLIDFFLRDELIDFDCSFALNRDGFKLFGRNLQVLAFANFVALDDVL